MRPKQIVRLTQDERTRLLELVGSGKAAARTLTHARALLKTDCGTEGPGWGDREIAVALEVSEVTIGRVRKRYVEEGLEAALTHRPYPRTRSRRLDGRQEAQLVTIACSTPPDGRDSWTLRLLADRMVELKYVASVSHETIRQTLKKTNSSHGRTRNG